MEPIVCIVGPTGSGKSELADELAFRLYSSVVSIDASQVYRGMDIGTAKEPPERRRVPLLMVDICDINTNYSVQLFQRDARMQIDALLQANKTPILCGGTGLYLDAVIDEMDFASGSKDSPQRARYNALAQSRGSQYLYDMLCRVDPESAQLIHPNNTRRVVRALEMHDAGESYAQNHMGLLHRKPHYKTLLFAVHINRERLYKRIDQRVDAMFAAGLVEEVRNLQASGLTLDTTAAQAIGYKEVLEALSGQLSLDDARDLIKRRTRHYAKRQLSWIRRDGRAELVDRDSLSLEEACDFILQRLRNHSHLGEKHV